MSAGKRTCCGTKPKGIDSLRESLMAISAVLEPQGDQLKRTGNDVSWVTRLLTLPPGYPTRALHQPRGLVHFELGRLRL